MRYPFFWIFRILVFMFFSLADAELVDFELDPRGHLKIATLCLLETSRDGLTEWELRHILGEEKSAVPSAIKRQSKLGAVGNMGVSFSE